MFVTIEIVPIPVTMIPHSALGATIVSTRGIAIATGAHSPLVAINSSVVKKMVSVGVYPVGLGVTQAPVIFHG